MSLFSKTIDTIKSWVLFQNVRSLTPTNVIFGALLFSSMHQISAQAATGLFLDEFSTQSYSNNNGTVNWSGNWIESNDDGSNSPTSGDILVSGGRLVLDNDDASPPSIRRQADLTGATKAYLGFNYLTSGSSLDSNDRVVVEISSNGGGSWDVLRTYSGSGSGSESIDIQAYISNNTTIRFRVLSGYANSGEFFRVDNVKINSSENPDFNFTCGGSALEIKALFILDDSGSVSTSELALQRQAVLDTLDYFLNNNITARVAIARFSVTGSTVIDYTDVTLANRPQFETALNTNYGLERSSTNWEAGFAAALNLISPVTPATIPDMAFFFTDGTVNSGGNPEDDAQRLKDLGIHIYSVGVDVLGDQPNTDIDEFRGVTDGPDTVRFNGTNTSEADYLPIDEYSNLRNEFDSLISTFCPIPNVLLVKRITAINGQTTNPNDGTTLTQVVDDTTSAYADTDSNPRWPSGYLIGAIDAGAIKPSDTIEYTIYFNNVGAGDAAGVTFCDRLQPFLSFVQAAYGAGQDIELELGNNPGDGTPNTTIYLTAVRDSSDRTQLVPSGEAVPSQCNLKDANNNGTVVLNLTGGSGTGLPNLQTLPGSSGPVISDNAYGFFQFVTRVDSE